MTARPPGPIESAIRAGVHSGQQLRTPSTAKPFTVASVGDRGVVLLLGEKEAATPLTWDCLEGIGDLLKDGRWLRIGSLYATSAAPGTLDAYLKKHINRATAGWVAAVLEAAGVAMIDRQRPARVRLRHAND